MSETQTDREKLFRTTSYGLLTVVLIAGIIYLGKSIIIPVAFAILLASLLLSVVSFLERKNVPKVFSILLPLVVSVLAILGILYLLSTQIANFFEDSGELQKRFTSLLDSAQKWVSQQFHISYGEQEQYIDETAEKVKNEGPKLLGRTFLSITETLSYVVLLPIFTFLILYYRDRLKKFLVELFKSRGKEKVLDIIHTSRQISQRYISGLLIETCIVFTLNTIGFLILGIEYAIFLALTAALLNLIPYVGMLVANILCVVVTFVSSDNPIDAVWVCGILALVQIFDNNVGMPLIVGNNVRMNALATIIGIIVGGALAGVPGMFLAIPVLAVLKVIFDRVPELKPFGILLGDDISGQENRPASLIKKLKKKLSS